MMEPRSSSLREKVKRLRQTFLDKMPATLGEARRLSVALKEAPADAAILAELFRAFHSIKGTAASFGLMEISAEAAAAEHLAAQLQNREDGGESFALPDFAPVLDRLEQLGTLARDSDSSSPTNLVPTGFDLATPADDAIEPRKMIFLCDDEEAQAESLAAQLSCFGYAITIFTDPESLRAAVLSARADAIIMDIMFPHKPAGGTDLISSLQKDLRSPPPVIFLSGRRDFEARLKAVQAGGEAYFTKPVKVTELVDVLDSLVKGQEQDPFRVLIVDDEPEIAAYHSFILEQVGMVTRLLSEPSKVLDVLAEFKPDLVLMDMYMPNCTGRDLSRMIRQLPEFLSLPIVFLSSETNKGKQVSALRVGAEGFLTKPIQPEDLISAVAIRAERMRTLRSLMVRDSLTGLFNHTFMSQMLDSSLAVAGRENRKVSFVMLDVDRFKGVNDTYGHPAGDQVLVALARLLRQRLRASDIVGRYGGEEFALILHDVSASEARTLVDELREDFSKVHFQTGDRDFTCTFSAGVSSFPQGRYGDVLLERADQALYAAKHLGRNQVVVDPSSLPDPRSLEGRLACEASLPRRGDPRP